MTVDYLFPPYTRDGCELCQLSRRQRDQEMGDRCWSENLSRLQRDHAIGVCVEIIIQIQATTRPGEGDKCWKENWSRRPTQLVRGKAWSDYATRRSGYMWSSEFLIYPWQEITPYNPNHFYGFLEHNCFIIFWWLPRIRSFRKHWHRQNRSSTLFWIYKHDQRHLWIN